MNINAINVYTIRAYATFCIYHYRRGIYTHSSHKHPVSREAGHTNARHTLIVKVYKYMVVLRTTLNIK